MSRRRRAREGEPVLQDAGTPAGLAPQVEPAALPELGPGQMQALEGPRAYVGATVMFCAYQWSCPAIVVEVYPDDVCDLVLQHAPRNGSCTTFRGRVAHMAEQLEVRPSDSGWHCIPAATYTLPRLAKGAA